MAVLPDVSGDFSIQRHESPAGRLVLDMMTDFAPGDIHSSCPREHPRVYDKASGALLVDTWATIPMWGFHWLEDGALELRMEGGFRVRVAADAARFATDADGWTDRPIAGLQAEVDARTPPPPPPPPVLPEIVRKGGEWLAVVALLAMLVGMGWVIWNGLHRIGASAPRRSVDAWVPRCPDGRIMPMHLDAEGRLVVPADLATGPLEPLAGEGRRFGNGRATVTIDGTDVLIQRAPGARVVSCPGLRSGAMRGG